MRRFQLITLIALSGALLTINAHATPSQGQQQIRSAPTGLALEIIYYKGRPPGYDAVPGSDSKTGGAWYALFRRVPSWQPQPGSLPVRAINILSRLEGDSVRVAVSVFVGVRFHEKEEPVATYLVHENERISVRELARFGVEPFEIKVVRVNPTLTSPPPVISEAGSIAFVSIAANDSTLPSYKLSLHNSSGKSVMALGVEVLVNGRKRLSSIPQGGEGRPLIPAGAVREINVAGADNARQITPEGYAPDSPPNQVIRISAAVFEDGSYEGDVETAASFRAFTLGRRIQIAKLIPLIQDALDSSGLSVPEAAARLKGQVSSLSTDVKAAVVDEFLRGFPALSQNVREGLKIAIEVVLNRIKTDFLKNIQEFEKGGVQSPDADAFRAWLRANKERYEKWLSRL